MLATSRKGLSIIGIRDLSDDVAAALGSGRGGSLNIDPVERLSRNACESLAGYGGWLNMNGVQSWPEGGLEAIVQHRGGLSIRVTDVSRERARVLARHRGNLYVVGVERLDEDAARELVAHVGTIDLANARGITPAAAAIFRQRAGIRFPEPTDASPSPSPGPLSAAAP